MKSRQIRRIANHVARNIDPSEAWTNNTIEGYFAFNGVKVAIQPPMFFDSAWRMWVTTLDGKTHGPVWVPWFSPVRRVFKQWQARLRRVVEDYDRKQLDHSEAAVAGTPDGKLTVSDG